MNFRRIRIRKPSPAMIVALTALFVALSGGAAAGTYVAATQLAGDEASAHKASSQSLAISPPAAPQLRAAVLRRLAAGRKCCRGPRGPRGPRGFRGPQGPSGVAHISSPDGPVVHLCAASGGSCAAGQSVAQCPAGTLPVGGAWAGDSPDPIVVATVGASYPYPSFQAPTGWAVIMINNADTTASFHASAICAS